MHLGWWYFITRTSERALISGFPTSNKGWKKFFFASGTDWSLSRGSRLSIEFTQSPRYGEDQAKKVIPSRYNFPNSFSIWSV